MPTRRKKYRPKKLKIWRTGADGLGSRWDEIPVSEHPYAVMLPIFGAPTELVGGEHRTDFLVTGTNVHFSDGFFDSMGRLGRGASYASPFHPEYFCRMLAKIGYAFSVAELGYNAFETALPDIILGTNPYIARYVGSGFSTHKELDGLHSLSLSRHNGCVIANIGLFSGLSEDTTRGTYLVIVGRYS